MIRFGQCRNCYMSDHLIGSLCPDCRYEHQRQRRLREDRPARELVERDLDSEYDRVSREDGQ